MLNKHLTEKLQKFKGLLNTFGFLIPHRAEFYIVNCKENQGEIGMKVGGFTHSCHVDSTDFVILLHFNEKTNRKFIKEYDDLWDLKRIE